MRGVAPVDSDGAPVGEAWRSEAGRNSGCTVLAGVCEPCVRDRLRTERGGPRARVLRADGAGREGRAANGVLQGRKNERRRKRLRAWLGRKWMKR